MKSTSFFTCSLTLSFFKRFFPSSRRQPLRCQISLGTCLWFGKKETLNRLQLSLSLFFFSALLLTLSHLYDFNFLLLGNQSYFYCSLFRTIVIAVTFHLNEFHYHSLFSLSRGRYALSLSF